jgi:hypothetical protein
MIRRSKKTHRRNRSTLRSPLLEQDRFLQNVRNELTATKGNRESFLNWDQELPGLNNLLQSLNSLSRVTKRNGTSIEEWNPFAQRALVDTRVPEEKSFVKDFEKVARLTTQFLQLIHESIHVLSLEPLFVGRQSIPSKSNFKNLCLLSEAFAFWYTDILVTPGLRSRLPDAELVYSKSAVSNYYFHPYRALSAAGIKSDQASLRLYLQAFTGNRTPIHKNQSAFAIGLRNRIVKFYVDADKPLGLLEKSLRQAKVLSTYRKRFCTIEGLPSLLPKAILDEPMISMAYHQKLISIGLPHIETLSQHQILRVKVRRHLQTKAYYVFNIQHALESDNLFSKVKLVSSALKTDLLKNLERYLLGIEKCLRDLAEETAGDPSTEKIDSILESVQSYDRMYSKTVLGPLKKAKIYIKNRGFILKWYTGKMPVEEFKILESENVTAKHIRALVLMLVNETEKNEKTIFDRKDNFSKISAVIDAKNLRKRRDGYNKLLLQDDILDLWTVGLWEIDPENSRYRELLFQYQ